MVKIGLLTKLLGLMLILSLISVGLMAWIGINGITKVKESTLAQSSSAFELKTTAHLEKIVEQHAEASEQTMNAIRQVVVVQSDQIAQVYAHPEQFMYVAQKLTSSFAGPSDPVPFTAPDDYQVYTRFCKDCMISFKYGCAQTAPGDTLSYQGNDLFSPNPLIMRDIGVTGRAMQGYKSAFLEHRDTLVWMSFGSVNGVYWGYPGASMPTEYDPRTRDWYTLAVAKGDFVWTAPYLDAGGAGLMTTAAKPVYDSNHVLLGVVSADVTIDSVNQKINNLRIGERGYSFIIDNTGTVVARPTIEKGDARWDESFTFTALDNTSNVALNAVIKKMMNGEKGSAVIALGGEKKYLVYAPITSVGWSFVAVLPQSEALSDVAVMTANIEKETQATAQTLLIASILLLVLAAIVSILFAQSITRPIKSLKNAAEQITNGDMSATLPQAKGTDEVAELTASMEMLITSYKAKAPAAKTIDTTKPVAKKAKK